MFRYGKQLVKSTADVSRMFPARYVHAPGGGSTVCTMGGVEAQPQLVDAAGALAQVEAFAPAGDVVILCQCREHPLLLQTWPTLPCHQWGLKATEFGRKIPCPYREKTLYFSAM